MTVSGTSPSRSADTAGDGRPRLHRGLKMLGTLFITLAAITPASSVFIISPGVVAQAGTGAFWAFAVAGVVGVFMALIYAELSSAFPLSGGEYAITARVLGRLPGFVVLGLILVTQLLVVAVIALGVGTYLAVLFPHLDAPIAAAATTLLATVLAVFDLKLNAWVTGIFLAIEMTALIVVSALGFFHPKRSLGDLIAHPVSAGAGSTVTAVSVGTIGAATAVAIFAYSGYGSAVYFGEETKDAPRNIAKTILWALAITVLAELIPTTAVLIGAPDLPSLFSADNMMKYFITATSNSKVNDVISLAVALAIFNAVLAIILITARMVFSTGRDAAWPSPISKALATVHPKSGSPWIATIATGTISAAFCFANDTFLLVVTSTTLIAVYAALALSSIAGRRNGTTTHAAYRMPAWPLAPVLALGAIGYVVYENFQDPKVGRPSLWTTLGIAVVSAVYYLAVVRRRGTWELKGAEDG
ncbi:APC family permease [Catenulispora rubra]|uniref:APC family permease n=1 Tax=Catenulispora rubra TaxID=280293 RepID=UPI0018923AE1|nr:APC family permease [Catenulispora rubra]